MLPPTDTVNPASSARPPLAPYNCVPSTLNWKPAISSGVFNKISIVSFDTSPKESLNPHELPSPPHSPHSSTTASPLQSPLQSSIASPPQSLAQS